MLVEKFKNDKKLLSLIESVLKRNDPIKTLQVYAFRHYCMKSYLDECEPEYCSFRLTNTCDYIKVIDFIFHNYGVNIITNEIKK